jgi:copper homeostasis protein
MSPYEMQNVTVEVCVDSIDSALNAQLGGASRVELCDNLPEGGTTPGYGTVVIAREQLDIDLFILIRPRGGDFLYSNLEFEAMKKDIRMAKEIGADGVVFGILNPDGSIDTERNRILRELAQPMGTTFHRAFDLSVDPMQGMEDIIKIGMDRILTSGQAATALEGKATLRELIRKAGKRISIMPGGGISEGNVKILKEYTGAAEYHVTLRNEQDSEMIFKRDVISMGKQLFPEYSRMISSAERIKELIKILNH